MSKGRRPRPIKVSFSPLYGCVHITLFVLSDSKEVGLYERAYCEGLWRHTLQENRIKAIIYYSCANNILYISTLLLLSSMDVVKGD
jgi:hypothetical protein